MSAQTALRIGLVTEVVPDDQLRVRAFELASEIAARRPNGVQGTVRAMWEARDLTPVSPPGTASSSPTLATPGLPRTR